VTPSEYSLRWKKLPDRWIQEAEEGENRLMAVWRGRHWIVIKNFWKSSLLHWNFPTILGKFKTSREAKQFCEEHYAAEKGVESENNLREHQKGDEGRQAAEAGDCHRSKRGRKV
jgi:hypothetical protein